MSGRVGDGSQWPGRLLLGLVGLQLLWSVAMKWVAPGGVPEHFAQLGWRMAEVRWLGLVELLCTLLFLVPRTSPLGAVLLTGYLGGATATHARLGDPVALYPATLAALGWAALWLREPRLRQLLAPLR